MTRRLLPLLALASACGLPIEPDGGPGSHRQAIVRGTPAPDDAAVALVARRVRCDEQEPMLLCSGALVAADLVLTAAHCLAIFGEEGQYEVFFGAALPPAGDGRFVRVARAWSHPGYDADTHAFDVALLRLATPVDVPPFALHDVAPRERDFARAIGFGETRGGARSSGTRLEGATVVVEVADASFRAGPAPSMSCTGDSGGPVVIDGALAGITVSGDVACESEAVAVRIDAILDDFLGPALEERPAEAPAANLAAEALCTTACTTDADCPAGLACEEDAAGDGRCMLLSLREGSFGATCEDDATCGDGGICARLEEATCRCFTPCSPPPGPPGARHHATGGGCSPAAGGPLVLAPLLLALRRREAARRRPPARQDQIRASDSPPAQPFEPKGSRR